MNQAGTLTFAAASGIYIATDAVGHNSHTNTMYIDAGTGTVTVAAGKHFKNGNGLMKITYYLL